MRNFDLCETFDGHVGLYKEGHGVIGFYDYELFMDSVADVVTLYDGVGWSYTDPTKLVLPRCLL